MKKFFCLLICILVYTVHSNAQGSLSTGLSLYLPFNGNTLDLSGNGNHATNYGATFASDASGRANCAYSFNGTSSYMEILNHVSLQADSQISLCAKVMVRGFYGGVCFNSSIIDKNIMGQPDYVYGFYSLRFTGTANSCSVPDTNLQNYTGFFAGSYIAPGLKSNLPHVVSTGIWDCLVFTFDGDTAKMYVNGVLRHKFKGGSLIGKNTGNVTLGRKSHTAYPYWYKGVMDEVRIYKRALTSSEVLDYCGFVAPTNIIKANFKDSSTTCFTKQFTDSSIVSSTALKMWLWDFGDGGQSALQNPIHTYSSAGIYNVRLIAVDSNGFSDTAIQSISVGTTHKFAKAGNDTIICPKTSTVTIKLNASGGVSYIWSPSLGLSDTTISDPIATLSNTSRYIVTVTDAFGCQDKDTINITINPGSINVIASPETIQACIGKEFQLNATGAKYYKWFPPIGLDRDDIPKPKLIIASSNSYIVTGTDSLGCTDKDTIVVKGFEKPNVKTSSDNSKADCIEKSALLSATGALSYSWTPAIYCENSNAPSTKVRPPATTVFTVKGIDANGCEGIDTITVFYEGKTVVRIPSAFTPNNDGVNDKIRPIIVCDFVMTEFSVFNRWGNQVFSSNDINKAWDGNSDGKPCDMNTYYYMIKGKNSKGEDVLLKGNITLIR